MLNIDDLLNEIDEFDYSEDKSYIQSTDCSKKHPGLRSIANLMCVNYLHNNIPCPKCKAYDTPYCCSNTYWCSKDELTIKSDMITYFGQELFNECEKQVIEKYGENYNKKIQYTLFDAYKDKNENKRNESKKLRTRNKIVKEYLNGDTRENLAKKYGYKPKTIDKIIRENGVNIREVEKTRNIKTKYLNGESVMSIAKYYDMSMTDVVDILGGFGITVKIEDVLDQLSISVYSSCMQGMGESEVAEKYNIDKKDVIEIMYNSESVLQMLLSHTKNF